MAKTSAAESKKNERMQKNVVQMGSNITGMMDDIAKKRDEIIDLKKKRSEINAKIKEKMEAMNAKGITKDAFRAALSYFEAATEQREGYDLAYSLAREGMGLPIQGEQLSLLHDNTSNNQKKENDDHGEDQENG